MWRRRKRAQIYPIFLDREGLVTPAMGPPFHILAKKGDVAERVIVAGDPARVKQLAQMLDNPRLVNENRQLLVYTGEYKGIPLTVATHGIGSGSATIVFEELRMLGARLMIRLGTAGGMSPDLKVGDFIIATGAATLCNGNSLGMYMPGYCLPASPSPDVTMNLIKEVEHSGEKAITTPVFSSDAFYAEDPDFAKKWSDKGVKAVEMECASLFALGWMRGFKTGALLMISDMLVGEKTELLTAEQLAPRVEKASRIVFEAAIKTPV